MRPDCPSGESERPHLPVSGEARAGRGSPGTGLARTRGQLWAPRRAAPSSSLLPPPESPQSPSAWRFLILGNFLNAPRQAPRFLQAAALHRPGTAPQPLRRERPVCHVRPQRPGQGSGGRSAPEPSPRGWPTRREAGGEKREEPGGRSLPIPGRRRPGQGGLIPKKGARPTTGASCHLACLLPDPSKDRQALRGTLICRAIAWEENLVHCAGIPSYQPKTLLLTGDQKAPVILPGGFCLR